MKLSFPKDELVDNYGIVSCGAAVFDSLDKTDLIAYRKEDYQYKKRLMQLLMEALFWNQMTNILNCKVKEKLN